MITVTSVEAQNRFGQLLDTAQREPVTITRHGRTAAFIVSPQDMDELINARTKRGKAVLSGGLHPHYAEAAHTLAETAGVTTRRLAAAINPRHRVAHRAGHAEPDKPDRDQADADVAPQGKCGDAGGYKDDRDIGTRQPVEHGDALRQVLDRGHGGQPAAQLR